MAVVIGGEAVPALMSFETVGLPYGREPVRRNQQRQHHAYAGLLPVVGKPQVMMFDSAGIVDEHLS